MDSDRFRVEFIADRPAESEPGFPRAQREIDHELFLGARRVGLLAHYPEQLRGAENVPLDANYERAASWQAVGLTDAQAKLIETAERYAWDAHTLTHFLNGTLGAAQ